MTAEGPRIFGSRILMDSISRIDKAQSWRLLYYYNLYRFSIGIFLVTSGLIPLSVGSLGKTYPTLFSYLTIMYAASAFIYATCIHKSWPDYSTTCKLVIVTDVALISAMIMTSGSLGSGLELLLIVSVAAAGMLQGGRNALAAAALATILLLMEHSYLILSGLRKTGGYTAMGFMGLGLFITAFIFNSISMRLRVSEDKLVTQQRDIINLNEVNQYVVNRLTSGVLVIDADEKVRLINSKAGSLLNLNQQLRSRMPLEKLSLPIRKASDLWISGAVGSEEQRVSPDARTTWIVKFQKFPKTETGLGYFIIFDDMSDFEKERQNDKLISMGRLTSSIAHEIRNPLGAISHAGQLLEESKALSNEDRKLTKIITKQSIRVNRIIQTVLELGRPAHTRPQRVDIYRWLKPIAENFMFEQGLTEKELELHGEIGLQTCIDKEQMQLAIINLLHNAMQYADKQRIPWITLNIVNDHRQNLPIVEIQDSGPGVDLELKDRIFEPFFTTSSTGNGLGLYISRQICNGNYAELNYSVSTSGEGANCFRIQLPAPSRCEKYSDTANNTA